MKQEKDLKKHFKKSRLMYLSAQVYNNVADEKLFSSFRE